MLEQDVSEYYNQTQNHYQRWWQLSEGMSLHYGLWYKDTRNFLESLNNTNQYLAELADIKEDQHVLDAGCGVGGSAIFLAKKYKARVTGISLSDLQVETARTNAKNHHVNLLVDYQILDFCSTKLNSNSFDVIWACESSSSAIDKELLASEWFRLLKPAGKLVLIDFFKAVDPQKDKDQLLDKWSATWAMAPLVTEVYLCNCFEKAGFEINNTNDLSDNIYKTARRMYLSYWLGLAPSVIYNTIIGARPYARNHYKSGYYQYIALKRKLWQYKSILAIKPLVT